MSRIVYLCFAHFLAKVIYKNAFLISVLPESAVKKISQVWRVCLKNQTEHQEHALLHALLLESADTSEGRVSQESWKCEVGKTVVLYAGCQMQVKLKMLDNESYSV